MSKKKLTLSLDPDVADWLSAQPEGGAGWITALVRQQMAPPKAAPQLSAETRQALQALEPGVCARAEALARYPQLIDAFLRGYVSIERAEAMAEEADARG